MIAIQTTIVLVILHTYYIIRDICNTELYIIHETYYLLYSKYKCSVTVANKEFYTCVQYMTVVPTPN